MITRGTYCKPLSNLRKNLRAACLLRRLCTRMSRTLSSCLIYRAPEIMAFTIDGEKHFIKVPLISWLGASTLQPIRVVPPKLQTPLPNGFMGDVDTAFAQQFLHVTIAQREAVIEPDPMADDLAGKAVIFVALGVSKRRHVGCLSFG